MKVLVRPNTRHRLPAWRRRASYCAGALVRSAWMCTQSILNRPRKRNGIYRWFKPDVVVGIGFWGHVPHWSCTRSSLA